MFFLSNKARNSLCLFWSAECTEWAEYTKIKLNWLKRENDIKVSIVDHSTCNQYKNIRNNIMWGQIQQK